MGLFQKNKSEKKSGDELPGYVDSLLEDSKAVSNEEIDEKFSVGSMTLKANYGIDHAIELMRDLPGDATDAIVSVITKTLESANIDVSKIIEDACDKEHSLDSQIDQLSDEINSLQEQITRKKDQINVSTAMLEETKKVRVLLETTSPAKNLTEKKSEKRKNSQGNNSESQSISEAETVELALEAQ